MRLPPELTDIIIDELSHDRGALRSCSFACKAFLPRSRVHLFHHVTLTLSSDSRRFCDLLSAVSLIAPLVKSLKIEEGKNDRDWSFWSAAHDCQWVCDDPVLPIIISSLPNLVSFTISAIYLRATSRLSFSHTLSTRTTGLTTLNIDCMHFDNLLDLLDMLAAFVNLKTLRLGTISTTAPFFSNADRLPLGIEEIEVDMEGSSEVIEMFLLRVRLKRLKRLSVTNVQNMEVLSLLIELTRDSLEALKMELPIEYANRYSLLDTSHLESLSIKLSTCSVMDWWVKGFKTETLGLIMLVAENCDLLLNSG
ncbi:uncharacterized protein EV420DRAFT_1519039 [Desarmillaria tabescens]|uniref:Uncharacterized protein n=1 Tax=Armillaria tabescens TaxID=1929756 RepID=A0AA39NDF1_ARMTA|nr:uncharacterized protein EV420DRAFT_1519039 [Desarmillaria tabescens]KAK0463592.1 hypothetical protein EV420DRAFT_1519039 [Desarmillaria tabescens]